MNLKDILILLAGMFSIPLLLYIWLIWFPQLRNWAYYKLGRKDNKKTNQKWYATDSQPEIQSVMSLKTGGIIK